MGFLHYGFKLYIWRLYDNFQYLTETFLYSLFQVSSKNIENIENSNKNLLKILKVTFTFVHCFYHLKRYQRVFASRDSIAVSNYDTLEISRLNDI